MMRRFETSTCVVLLMAAAAIMAGVDGGAFDLVTGLVTVGLGIVVMVWWHWCGRTAGKPAG
ncbi:MAG: hypothetical protein FWD61_15490 [Phycisphaerales bacterium]|nr:hypothetical protein [Phycisphaerales bacterium]